MSFLNIVGLFLVFWGGTICLHIVFTTLDLWQSGIIVFKDKIIRRKKIKEGAKGLLLILLGYILLRF